MTGIIKPQSISHWYDRQGNPRYDIEKKSGKGKRKTDIRDARKFGWLPSVTSILKIVDKPLLNAWIANRTAEACETVANRRRNEMVFKIIQMNNLLGEHPTIEEMMIFRASVLKNLAEYVALSIVADKAEIKAEADAISKEARETGLAYHRDAERIARALASGEVAPKPKAMPIETFEAFLTVWKRHRLEARLVEWSFASIKYGFGGRLDFAGLANIRPEDRRLRTSIIDYKTQNTKGKSQFTVYQEVPCQLAAYAYGIGSPAADLGTIYIDTSIPGNVELIYHPDNDDYFYAFLEAFRLWKGPLGKNYEV